MNFDKGQNKLYEIILEIGTAYTKIGFSMDSYPKKIVKLDMLKQWQKSRLSNELYIEEQLYHLFNIELVCSLKGRTIIFIYNYYQIEDIHNIIGNVLFTKFEAAKISFMIGNVLPLYISGHNSGVIVDIGYYQSTACAVYDGFSLLHLGGRIGEGGKDAAKRVQALTQDHLGFEQLEEIAEKYGSILNKTDEDGKQQIRIKYQQLVSQFELRNCYTQTYFGNWMEEESNVAYGLLAMITKLKDPDIISKVLQNIIITGGGRLMNNFMNRFKLEMLDLLKNEFKQLNRYQFNISLNTQRNQKWIGANLLVQVGGQEKFMVTHQKFKDQGNMFILKSDAYNFIGIK